jgi:hypothetical protein
MFNYKIISPQNEQSKKIVFEIAQKLNCNISDIKFSFKPHQENITFFINVSVENKSKFESFFKEREDFKLIFPKRGF